MTQEPEGDKRQRARYPVICDVILDMEGTRVAGKCLDFSTRGFSILVPKQSPVTDPLKLSFRLDEKEIWEFEARVAYRRSVRRGKLDAIRLGLRITQYPANPEVFFGQMGTLVQKQTQKKKPAASGPSEPEGPRSEAQAKSDQHQQARVESQFSTRPLTFPGERTGEETQRDAQFETRPASDLEMDSNAASDSAITARRTDRRVLCELAGAIHIQGRRFHIRTLEFSGIGFSAFAPDDLPTCQQYKVVLEPERGDPLIVDVVEKERSMSRRADRVVQRVGVHVVSGEKQYRDFLINFAGFRDERDFKTTVPGKGGHARSDVPTEIMDVHPEDARDGAGLLGSVRYQFLRKLGKGGFAEVYLVKDLALNRQVAMKVLAHHYAKDTATRWHFIHEAQIAAKFEHPNIATVHEVGEIQVNEYDKKLAFPRDVLSKYPLCIVYFTMQYIQGHPISRILENEIKLEPLRALRYLRGLANALQYAHGKGVVHRDVKPENVMVTTEGQILVTDFGIAKVQEKKEKEAAQKLDAIEDSNVTGSSTGKSQTKSFMGTPIYASPEQAMGEVDERSDLYSLGVAAYEMLCGKPPFKGKRWLETIAMHLHEQPEPLIKREPKISQNVNDLVMRCLEKDPANRFQSAGELLMTLDEAQRFLEEGDLVVEAMSDVDQETHDLVKQVFQQFGKTYRVMGTYPESHEMVLHAAQKLEGRFQDYFEKHERLDIKVESMRFLFHMRTVWEEDQKENSFCFNLYRDGIRRLMFFRGMPLEELTNFITQLFRYVNNSKSYEQDAVTILFQAGLEHLDFEYVDSFYEDTESQARIAKHQQNLLSESDWDLNALASYGKPLSRHAAFLQKARPFIEKINLDQYADYFNRKSDQPVRQEAIRIFLALIQRQGAGERFDAQFRILEDIVFSCLTDNDLNSVVFIFSTLEKWLKQAEENDPRKLAQRMLAMKDRLSQEAFLQELVDKYFNIDRGLKDSIKALAQFLIPNQAVKVLFNRFQLENEEWKKVFLAELCVSASGATLTPLVKMGLTLPDEEATILLSGFSREASRVSKSVFLQWATHSGPETRVHLMRLVTSLDRPEAVEILKKYARVQGQRYEEVREFAWRYLQKHHPRQFEVLLTSVFDQGSVEGLSSKQRQSVIEMSGSTSFPQRVEFLSGILFDQGALGQSKLSVEDRVLAADTLFKLGTPEAVAAIEKMAKKLLGSREVIQHCKQLMGRMK